MMSMRWSRSLLLAGAAFLVVEWACTAQPRAADADTRAAQEGARRDAESPEGKRWREAITNDWLAKAIQPAGSRCDKEAPSGRERTFTTYVRVAKSGKVLQAWVDLETPYSVCFRETAKAITWPTGSEEHWYEFGMAPGPPEPSR